MAGKLCFGKQLNNAGAGRLTASKAFCEGMSYRSGGTLLGRPAADNPHEAGSLDFLTWDAGWNVADDAAGGIISKTAYGCCAVSSEIVPV